MFGISECWLGSKLACTERQDSLMSIQELAMKNYFIFSFKDKDFSAPIIFKGLIPSLFNLMSPQIFCQSRITFKLVRDEPFLDFSRQADGGPIDVGSSAAGGASAGGPLLVVLLVVVVLLLVHLLVALLLVVLCWQSSCWWSFCRWSFCRWSSSWWSFCCWW